MEDFAEVTKNLVSYRSESNSVRTS